MQIIFITYKNQLKWQGAHSQKEDAQVFYNDRCQQKENVFLKCISVALKQPDKGLRGFSFCISLNILVSIGKAHFLEQFYHTM